MTEEMIQLQQKISELEQLNRELDTIIENSYDVIYITDKQGNTLKTNSAIERITGIPKHYFIGKNVTDLMNRGILKESVTFKVIEQEKTVTVVQKNYKGQETLITGSPIFNEQGAIEKVVTNIRDWSELSDLMDELKKVQKLNDEYKKELEKLKTLTNYDPDVVVHSETLQGVYEMAGRIATVDATVLILGETGVGKDVLARYIFKSSQKKGEIHQGKLWCYSP